MGVYQNLRKPIVNYDPVTGGYFWDEETINDPAATEEEKAAAVARLTARALASVAQRFPVIKGRYQKLGETACARAEELTEAVRVAADTEDKLGGAVRGFNLVDNPRVWSVVATASSSTYSSQGFEAAKYAERSVLAVADKLNRYGIASHLQKVEKSDTGRWNCPQAEFVLWAALDPAGLRVFSLLPGLPLKETVRRCWLRGVNPRVYNPFLPHEFEAQNGLDYFGGYVRA
jgi:hypothetical protein